MSPEERALLERLSYDYIVVGGGAAGCVLVARLLEASSEERFSILLLEEGAFPQEMPDEGNFSDPKRWCALFQGQADRQVWTQAQQGCEQRHVAMAQGKVMGGSTSMNAMMYVHGTQEDYDRWAEDFGAGDEWSWNGVKDDLMSLKDPSYRGHQEVNVFGHKSPEAGHFVEAATKCGHGFREDYNDASGDPTGVSFTQYTISSSGIRRSAFESFLMPFMSSPRLTVLSGCQVQALLVENSTEDEDGLSVGSSSGGDLDPDLVEQDQLRVCGVDFLEAGSAEVSTRYARREVIVCCGALKTPQLLMLSGIGPKAQLEELGVPVLLDCPGVGQNLQDHMIVPVVGFSRKALHPLRESNGQDAVVFCRCPDAYGDSEEPASCDAEIVFDNCSAAFQHVVPSVIMNKITPQFLHRKALQGRKWAQWTRTLMWHIITFWMFVFTFLVRWICRRLVSFFVIQSHPRSVGHISLVSRSMSDNPLVHPNYLADDFDRRVYRSAILSACNIMQQMKQDGHLSFQILPLPGQRTNPANLDQYIRLEAMSSWHPMGTCRMGPPEDPMSVVLPDLRVKGCRGLRVADASVIPSMVAGNLAASVMLVALQASKFLLRDAANGRSR